MTPVDGMGDSDSIPMLGSSGPGVTVTRTGGHWSRETSQTVGVRVRWRHTIGEYRSLGWKHPLEVYVWSRLRCFLGEPILKGRIPLFSFPRVIGSGDSWGCRDG